MSTRVSTDISDLHLTYFISKIISDRNGWELLTWNFARKWDCFL